MVLFSNLKKFFGESKEKPLVISNGLFDTTRANAVVNGFEGMDLFRSDLFDPYPLEKVGVSNPFRGNIDCSELKKVLEANSKRTAIVMLTLTNNTAAGQPVSLSNIKETKKICDQYNIPLWIDSCRIADNAYMIKCFEEGYKDVSVKEILKEIMSFADGFHFSVKKALANIGGIMCIK